jgi:hypothetical protein
MVAHLDRHQETIEVYTLWWNGGGSLWGELMLSHDELRLRMNLFLHTFWWNGVGLSHKELRLMTRLFYFAHIMVECWPIVV